MHSEHEKDEDCKKLKSKMDTVIQSCANQHMVSKEVFTEKHLKKKILPLDYEIRKTLRCFVCASTFSNEQQLNSHTCGKITQVAGRHYGKDYGNNGNEHIDTKDRTSKGTVVETVVTDKTGKKHVCLLCKQKFENKSDLDKHFLKCRLPCSKERKKEKKPMKSSLKSDENEKETKDTSNNTKPVFDINKDSNQESQVKSFKLKCDFCEKYFYCSESLEIHVGIYKKVNMPCQKCGKEYKSVKQFNNHLRTCKDAFFTCDFCKKIFNRKDSLLRHTRVHYPDLSDYKCPVCSTRCVNEKDLQIHTVQEHISST